MTNEFFKTVKGSDGWYARTNIEMELDGKILRLETGKADGGIATHAQVWTLGTDGSMSLEICGDFGKTIGKAAKRCTVISVTELHAKILRTMRDAVLAQAMAFYAAKAQKAAA